MSGSLMGKIYELKLLRSEREVLLAMAENANDDGMNCYPGVPYLAWKTDYSERQVQRILRSLEKMRLIEKVSRAHPGPGYAVEYVIHVENGIKKPPFASRPKKPLSELRYELKAKYGITLEEYEELLARQNNMCAICLELPTNSRLAVDHDHSTGRIRGLLCARCNLTLGGFKDDPERLRKAKEYLEAAAKNPTSDVTFSENPTSSVTFNKASSTREKVTSGAEKVTSEARKGDILGSPYKEEPHEPCIDNNTVPLSPAAPPPGERGRNSEKGTERRGFDDPPDPRFARDAEPDELFVALEDVCRMPPRQVRTDKQKQQLDQTWKILTKAGVPAEDVRVVGEYYYGVLLIGRDGVALQPAQVREHLTAAKIWKQQQSGKSGGLDEATKQFYVKELRKRLEHLEPADPRRRIINEALARLPQLSSVDDLRELRERLISEGVEIS